jgi:hypothetical protein
MQELFCESVKVAAKGWRRDGAAIAPGRRAGDFPPMIREASSPTRMPIGCGRKLGVAANVKARPSPAGPIII